VEHFKSNAPAHANGSGPATQDLHEPFARNGRSAQGISANPKD